MERMEQIADVEIEIETQSPAKVAMNRKLFGMTDEAVNQQAGFKYTNHTQQPLS